MISISIPLPPIKERQYKNSIEKDFYTMTNDAFFEKHGNNWSPGYGWSNKQNFKGIIK